MNDRLTSIRCGWTTVLPCLLLFLLPALLYAKTAGYEFIPSWDDGDYILRNPYAKGLSIENIRGAFTEIFVLNYAPIHILSYMLDYELWGLDPAGYHLTNVLFHAANTVLLYLVLKRISARPWVSFAAALLFSLHPLNVENVAWVTERKTLLATFFSFLSLLAYFDFREKNGGARLVLSLVLFCFAVLSKPLAIVLPLVVTAYEYCRGARPKILVLLPFYLISCALAMLAVGIHVVSGGVDRDSLSLDVLFGTVYPTMLPVFWKYVRLVILPFGLSGYYDTELYSSWLAPPVIASLVTWLLVTAAVFYKGNGQVRFWFLWFWIWLLPVSNVIPLQVYYADRYMYLPAVGLFVLVALALEKVFVGREKEKDDGRSACSKKGVAPRWTSGSAKWGVLALGALFFAVLAYDRIGVWRDEVTFWEDTVRKSPHQDRVRLNLGYAYEMRGRLAEAEREYLEAVNIYPSPEAVANLRMVRLKSDYLKRQRQGPGGGQ